MLQRYISSATILSAGLVGLMTVLVAAAGLLGFVPDARKAALDGRVGLCEAMAVHSSLAAGKGDVEALRASVQAVVRRRADVLSAAVRTADGRPLAGPPLAGLLGVPVLGLGLFLALSCFVAFLLFLKRGLRQMDPSSAAPDRVRAVLDALSEGVLLVDETGRIVMANRAFADSLGMATDALPGRRADALPWAAPAPDQPAEYPWVTALREGAALSGVPLGLRAASGETRILVANATPIMGGDGRPRGTLVAFEDVTAVEEMNARLRKMLADLHPPRGHRPHAGRDLEASATRAPLAGPVGRLPRLGQFQ
ncbi:MAG: PAS domain-containing protein [Acidobacteria bacterium]|nr:PAS domain-containing protein [Acidobacteriota bacterium]